MGKQPTQPEHDQYCDGSTTFNMKQVVASKSTKASENIETDYSIPGKKRGSYKQDGD